ncbi:hypothetical protein SLEP1_g56584 [Rubroshorea leprosula]|uniref:Uncharacterized protein n=1 Tax=Rubroshorea leprosula TaxID=152421 RepID=A0AAV5MN44_9ROSI|nr:hypothetical protein SLEP1_g56584 [Rubroshorea leprosula]
MVRLFQYKYIIVLRHRYAHQPHYRAKIFTYAPKLPLPKP